MRLESSADSFLSHSKEMALLCRSVCHILFLIKVIQNEVRNVTHGTESHSSMTVELSSDQRRAAAAKRLYSSSFLTSPGW